MRPKPFLTLSLAVSLLSLLAIGCGSPSRANIDLRKQVQQLQTQVSELEVRHRGDQQTINGLQDRSGNLPTLSSARLNQLFTTHGLDFGRLSGGLDLDPSKPGDEGFVVYVVPVDQVGEKLKAAGSFDVQAFDLADAKDPLLGRWQFDLQRAKAAWTSALLQYGYVLTCPWQKRIPQHRDVTLKVTFFDALTQTPITAQKVIRVNPPALPSTQPN
jgi:hypothetical protein